jgi:hypothetical protein
LKHETLRLNVWGASNLLKNDLLNVHFPLQERKYSEYTIMKQNELERSLREDSARNQLTVDHEGAFDDEGNLERGARVGVGGSMLFNGVLIPLIGCPFL